MPLFLFVSGYFTMHSITKYNTTTFIKRRAQRILFPLVSSMLILLPIHAALKLYFKLGPGWLGCYFDYLNPLSINFTLEHLWFLYYILIFSVIINALYVLNKQLSFKHVFDQITDKIHNSFAITITFWITLNICIFILGIFINKIFNFNTTWFPLAGLCLEFPMYLFGLLCYNNTKLLQMILKPEPKKIIFLISFFFVVYLLRIVLYQLEIINSWTFFQIIDIGLRWVLTLSIIMTIRRVLNYSNSYLRFLADASYPVYLFHQPVIVAVSLVIIRLNFTQSTLASYLTVSLISLVLTYVSYVIFIKYNRLGAILFTGTNKK